MTTAAPQAMAQGSGTTPAVPSTLSKELRDLAADGAHAARRPQLEQLAEAVDGGSEAQLWADTDVLRALDVDGPLDEVVEESPSAKRLEMLRTVLVFCPLIITWAGLYVAGGAYDRLLASQPDAARSAFLKLWLGGFGGQTAFSLDRLALMTAGLIALLVLTSVLLERQRQRDELRFRTVGDRKRQELRTAALHTELALRPYGSGSPQRLREEMIRGSAAFGEIAEELKPVTTDVRLALQALGDVAKRLESASLYTSLAADRIGDSSQAFGALVPQVQRSLVEASSALTTAVEESSAQVRATMLSGTATMAEHLSETTDGVSRVLAEGAAQLTSQVELSSAWVVGAAEALMTQSDNALTAASQGHEDVRAAIAAMQASVEEALGREVSAAEVVRAAEALAHESALTRVAVSGLEEAVTWMARAAGSTDETVRQVSAQLAEHVEVSSSWVVGAAEALLAQGEQTSTAANHTYDQLSRTVHLMQAQVETAIDREAGSTEVLRTAQSLLSEASAGRAAVTALGDALTRMSTTADGIDTALRDASRHLSGQLLTASGVVAQAADAVLGRGEDVLATAADSADQARRALVDMRAQLDGAAARDTHLIGLVSTAESLLTQAASSHTVTADLVRSAAAGFGTSGDATSGALARAATALETLVQALEQRSRTEDRPKMAQPTVTMPVQVAP